jgi:hypothetical protein
VSGWTLGAHAGVFLLGYLVGRLVHGGRHRITIEVDDEPADPPD